MKKLFKPVGAIAFVAMMAFLAIGCATSGGSTYSSASSNTPITVTVTGDFSDYAGRKAWIAVGDDAFGMPLNVNANTASLPFTILRYDNDRAFTRPGSYMVVLWFRQGDDKSTDATFVLMNRQINEGDNTLLFSSFSEL